MRENNLRTALIVKMIEADFHVQRVEDRYSTGIADINACRHGIEFWIETKIVKRPNKEGYIHTGLRPTQKIWIKLRQKAGGKVFVVFKVENQTEIYLTDIPLDKMKLSDCICFKNYNSVVDYLISIENSRHI